MSDPSRFLTRLRRRVGAMLGARPLAGPAQVQLGIADACDGNCIFCRYKSGAEGADASSAIMPRSLAENIIEQLARARVDSIEVCGRGEPTLHPDLLDLLEVAVPRFPNVSVVTNGRRLHRLELGRLAAMPLEYINISLNAATPESYVAVHRGATAEHFARIVDSVRMLSEQNRETGKIGRMMMSLAVCEPTVDDVPRFASLAAQVGIDEIQVFPAQLYEGEGMDALALDEGMVQRVLGSTGEAARIAEASGLVHNLGQFEVLMRLPNPHRHAEEAIRQAPCYAGFFFCQIAATGQVYPCCACDAPVGDLTQMTWDEIWRADRYQTFRRRARNLPEAGKALPGCHCEECFYAHVSVAMHKKLRPWSR